MIPIAPLLGGMLASEGAKAAGRIAGAALGGSKGQAPDTSGSDGEASKSGSTGFLGLPVWNADAAKSAVIQGGVITALVVMFFIGLTIYIGRSVKV